MRIRQVVVVFVVAVACTIQVSSVAAACKACDPFLHCITAPVGAVACLESPGACAMFLQCLGGPGKRMPDGAEFLTTWSLFDASVGSTPARALAVHREAGDLALGDEARAGAGADEVAGAMADAVLAFGEVFALSFVDAAGDGFALERAAEGGRVRLEVREVSHDVPGRVLASESLGPRDRLRVPVRVEGRERVLLIQAADVSRGAAPHEVARLRRALEAAARVLPARSEPLLRAHPR